MKHAFHILGALALGLLGFVSGASAQEECRIGRGVCEIDGGSYHAAAPRGQIRGAVVFLHGYGGTGRGIIRNAGLVEGALSRGYAIIAPQGQPRYEGDTGGAWNSRDRGAGRRDDVAFLSAVADDAAQRFGIARDSFALAGFSGGGMMSWAVACAAPGSFAAYGPVAGLLWRPLPESCAGPVRFHHTHGWTDTVVPLEGRILRNGALVQGDLFTGFDMLRKSFGCAAHAPDSHDARGVYLTRTWSDCAGAGEITFALHPGGHAIPRRWMDLFLDWYERPET